jgi:K+-sensing histidine kinase KdpD
VLEGDDPAAVLAQFARANQVTQIFLARPSRASWTAVFARPLVERVVRLAAGIRVTIVADRRQTSER